MQPLFLRLITAVYVSGEHCCKTAGEYISHMLDFLEII